MFIQSLTRRSRLRGFTLVELLVVVLIIAILATVTLFALFNAGEAARAARTRSQIQKIHELIAPIWEGYRTRRVDIAIPASTNPDIAAQLRLDALREIMRLELPDRKTDIVDDPVTVDPVTSATLTRPAKSLSYARAIDQITSETLASEWPSWTTEYQGAECLYLIISQLRDLDGSALEYFRESEIGDADEDGMLEILDGWETPIEFVRWPAGFLPPDANTVLQNGTDPDAFDSFGVYDNTYYLFPLIVSAGPDKEFDIFFDDPDTPIQYSTTSSPANNPYATFGSDSLLVGTIHDTNDDSEENDDDNLHNHFLEITARY